MSNSDNLAFYSYPRMRLQVAPWCLVLCFLFLVLKTESASAAVREMPRVRLEAPMAESHDDDTSSSSDMSVEVGETSAVTVSSSVPLPMGTVSTPTLGSSTALVVGSPVDAVASSSTVTLPKLEGLLALPVPLLIMTFSLFVDYKAVDLRAIQSTCRLFRAASRAPLQVARTHRDILLSARRMREEVSQYTRVHLHDSGLLKPRIVTVVPIQQLFILQIVMRLFDPTIAGYRARATPAVVIEEVDGEVVTESTESAEDDAHMLVAQQQPSRAVWQPTTAPLSDKFLKDIVAQLTQRIDVPLQRRTEHCLIRLVDALLAMPLQNRPSPAMMQEVLLSVFTVAHTVIKPQFFMHHQRAFRELESEVVD